MRSSLVILLMALFANLNGQELKGRVLGKADNMPLADVKIKLIGKSASAVTNSKGDFNLFISLGYPCLVEFTKSGYQTEVLNLKEEPEKEIELHLVSTEIIEEPIVLQDLNTYDTKSVDIKPVFPGC